MCTVSFIKTKKGYLLTSNRDEQYTRSKALSPAIHGQLLFPKDTDKGGTWIAAKKNGDAAVLLNGATEPHVSQPPYRQSRGILLLQVLAAPDPLSYLNNLDMHGMEPFTLILFQQQHLYEYRWNGTTPQLRELPVDEKHIWSSATLYSPEVMAKRKRWFAQWNERNVAPSQFDVVNFHRLAGDGDVTQDLLMNRDGKVCTVSITSIFIGKHKTTMHYWDAATGAETNLSFAPEKKQQLLWFKRLMVRLRHWEYWPFHVVYAPLYFYWFWLCLKARSFFFFNTANPGIRNGGFLMESKNEIYNLLPTSLYPTTVFCANGSLLEELHQQLLLKNLSFPLIAKPDIGLRGMGVSLIKNIEELKAYYQNSSVDFLLQQYIDLPMEAGIFYYRMPGQAKGSITGIVEKEFMRIKGDGLHTIKELLSQQERFILQLPALELHYGEALNQILPEGQDHLVVPFGNHSRGAKFLDSSYRADEALNAAMDKLCSSIPGFYFGRLDIKFNSWEELQLGKNFSIIELNGAGSEPAHIYDPAHSIFFAWREIIRHWKILYKVSIASKKMKKIPYMTTKEGLQMLRENSRHIQKIA